LLVHDIVSPYWDQMHDLDMTRHQQK
jgi:hypothetical protein